MNRFYIASDMWLTGSYLGSDLAKALHEVVLHDANHVKAIGNDFRIGK